MARKITKALRFRILARDGFKCRYCGASAPNVELVVDHFIPIAESGGSGEENLVTACFDCNAGKSDRKVAGLKKPVVSVTNRRGPKVPKKDPRNRMPRLVRKDEPDHHVLNTGAVIETGDALGEQRFAKVWCESHQGYEWHLLNDFWIGKVGSCERLGPPVSELAAKAYARTLPCEPTGDGG